MSHAASIAGAQWLKDESLQRLLAVLCSEGEESKIAGGAVRNALLGEPVTDIDIATTALPDEVVRRLEAAGIRSVPTGIEHGTVTAVVDGRAFEITTLRADVETDGRHAKVAFGRDWKEDAERRDFTINALYAEPDGSVVDFVGGLSDIEARKIRFIGDAQTRIREDFLRILRFFRFFAWYGSGRPDAEGLKASARMKDGLGHLSAERVWSELKKLLAAPDPSRALLWMRQAGVLTAVLPESEKWGIDAIHALVKTERDLGWAPDPMLRLVAMIPPSAERVTGLAARLKLSRAEAERLTGWAMTPDIPSHMAEGAFAKALYRGDLQGIRDRLQLALAGARGRAAGEDGAMMEAGGFSRLIAFLERWERPAFPLKGGDLRDMGFAEGPRLGAALKRVEEEWVESGFALDGDALKARAAETLED